MSQHCASAFVDQQLKMRDRLRNGLGPGKRAGAVALGPSRRTGLEALGPAGRRAGDLASWPGTQAEDVSLRGDKAEGDFEDINREDAAGSGAMEANESDQSPR